MTVLDRPGVASADVPPTAPAHSRRLLGPVAVALGAGSVGVLALALVVGGATAGAVGDPVVEIGLPVARLAGRIAALGVVGALLFAAVLLPSSRSMPSASRRALRAASAWATAWAAATAIDGLLTLSQVLGGGLDAASLQTFVVDVPAGRATVLGIAVAVLVAAVAHRCTTRGRAGGLLVLALAAVVVPLVLTGHSAAADDHVLAVTNLSVHVVVASVWVGGLLALLLHGRGGDDTARAAARFSSIALACFVVIGLSGVLATWIVLGSSLGGLSAAVGSGYGWLLVGKTTALLVLGVLGWAHRRHTLPRLAAGVPGSFRRFAGVEVVVMLATVALAVGLSTSPPPSASAEPPAGAVPAAVDEAPPAAADDPMAGHDHGELSVTVLIDQTRFHVAGPVEAGSRVSVHNSTPTEVTITAADGSFDVVVPGFSLLTFPAPTEPGSYSFTSRHSPSFADVLVVD